MRVFQVISGVLVVRVPCCILSLSCSVSSGAGLLTVCQQQQHRSFVLNHKGATNELLPICADVGCLLAPSSQVLVQMVDTCSSVNADLNKYHLCLHSEHTEGLREKGSCPQPRDIYANLEYNVQSN